MSLLKFIWDSEKFASIKTMDSLSVAGWNSFAIQKTETYVMQIIPVKIFGIWDEKWIRFVMLLKLNSVDEAFPFEMFLF